MRHYARPSLAAVMLLTNACGNSMNHGAGDMQAAIGAAQAETVRHAEACLSADTIAGVIDELGRHEQAMDSMMRQMDGAMGRISHCSADPKGHMLETLFDVRMTMPDHRVRLENASNLDAAHSECSTHAATMASMLEEMDTELHRMSCVGM